jgi:glycerol-3-phosphate dehydrogenase
MAMHLDDVFIRRTRVFYETPDQGMDMAPQVANVLAAELGWDSVRRAAELDRYRGLVEASRRWMEGRDV